MTKFSKTLSASLALSCLISWSGCNLLTGTSVSSAVTGGSTSTGSGGSGGTLTTSDLVGVFDGTCNPISNTFGPTGYNYYRDILLILSGGTFQFARNWYTSSNCTSGGDIEGSNSGTVAVGSMVSSSSSLANVQFTITLAEVRSYTGPGRTIVNSACAVNLTTSSSLTVTGNSCGGGGYIANATNGTLVDNVVQISGTASGSTLQLGAFAINVLMTGVYHGGTIPSTATVTFIKR